MLFAMRLQAIALLVFSLVLATCKKEETTPPPTPAAAKTGGYEQEVLKWRSDREARLKSDDGWLTLVGLYWLHEGANKVGSAKGSDVLLPAKAAADCGALSVRGESVTFAAKPDCKAALDGKPVTSSVPLLNDTADKGPSVIEIGSIRFYVIKRSDKLGVRVKDSESETRRTFKGIETFPIDGRYRVVAKFEPYQPPRTIPITNILGQTTQEQAPGALVFNLGGSTYRLDPIIEEGDKDFFIIFKDATSAKETYGAGRYLYASPPDAHGNVIVDFNKAYNPPCVFTPYATCPLPPAQNRLPIRIEAGEKKWGQHGASS
jgi:uncharacterized protein (DUF1684 family)